MSTFHGFWRRNAATFAGLVVILALGCILYVQALATAKLQQQVEGQQAIIKQIKGVTDQINENSQQRTAQINQLNRHLDCVVVFFTQKDRTQKAIDNIENCTLKNTTTGQVTSPKSPSPEAAGTSTQTPPETAAPAEQKISAANQNVVKNTAPTDTSIFDRVNNLINKAVGVQ